MILSSCMRKLTYYNQVHSSVSLLFFCVALLTNCKTKEEKQVQVVGILIVRIGNGSSLQSKLDRKNM